MSDERLRRLERAAAAAGPGTDDTLRLYSELRRAGADHMAAIDRLWLAFGAEDAIAPIDKLAFAAELAGEKFEDSGYEIDRILWPVDAVVLAETIGLQAEDLDGVVHDMAEADAADPDDEDAVEGMHELAAAANNDGLPSQFRFLLARDASLPKAIGDAVQESGNRDLDLALDRRMGDSSMTLYVRGGLVTESYDPDGRSILVDFNQKTAFVYQVRRTKQRRAAGSARGPRRYVTRDVERVERTIYSLDDETMQRQRFSRETLALQPLCKKLWELQSGGRGNLASFWAMRRALDFAVNGLLSSISSGYLNALGADDNRAYLQGGLSLSAGSLWLQ